MNVLPDMFMRMASPKSLWLCMSYASHSASLRINWSKFILNINLVKICKNIPCIYLCVYLYQWICCVLVTQLEFQKIECGHNLYCFFLSRIHSTLWSYKSASNISAPLDVALVKRASSDAGLLVLASSLSPAPHSLHPRLLFSTDCSQCVLVVWSPITGFPPFL